MNNSATTTTTTTTTTGARGVWSDDEHERFLEGLHMYPNGPWKAVADFVGTRTVRQVQTHAQKYHEKAARRLRDLHKHRERTVGPEPTIDLEMQRICEQLQRNRVPLSPRSAQQQQRSMDLFAEAAWVHFGGDSSMATDAHGMAPEEIPSFDECIDFLIDTLASTTTSSSSDSGSP